MTAPVRREAPPRVRRARWRDPWLWLGLLITVACLWLALRDVSFAHVARDMARADFPLLIGLSVPAHVLAMWLRALRWRHFTDAVQPMPAGALFRATSVGFMANNLFPLRAGELVRAWVLARETGAHSAAVLGTVVLERVVDTLCFLAIAGVLIGIGGMKADGARTLALGAPLVAVALLPVIFVGALRVAPGKAIALFRSVARPFLSARLAGWLEELLRRFAEGLGSLRGGMHLFWIALHSALIWLVVSVIPLIAGILALGIDLGPPLRLLAASYVTLVAVGVAVAIPSAPGFFGPYHLACREALTRFGVPETQALATGTLVHAIFWVTITALGLAVLRFRHTPLAEIEDVVADAGKDSSPDRR